MKTRFFNHFRLIFIILSLVERFWTLINPSQSLNDFQSIKKFKILKFYSRLTGLSSFRVTVIRNWFPTPFHLHEKNHVFYKMNPRWSLGNSFFARLCNLDYCILVQNPMWNQIFLGYSGSRVYFITSHRFDMNPDFILNAIIPIYQISYWILNAKRAPEMASIFGIWGLKVQNKNIFTATNY